MWPRCSTEPPPAPEPRRNLDDDDPTKETQQLESMEVEEEVQACLTDEEWTELTEWVDGIMQPRTEAMENLSREIRQPDPDFNRHQLITT